MISNTSLLTVLTLATASAIAGPAETVMPKFAHDITNIPGKSMIVVEVDYPPAVASHAHRHPPSAFIYAYVLSGSIRSQVEGGPLHVYQAGEGWYETPGAHHTVSENASATKPAKLLAIFVVDSNDKPLVTPDTN